MRRLVCSVLAPALLAIGWIGVAPSAEAATPTCTKVFEPDAGNNARLRVPASSSYSYNCLLGQGNANDAVTALQDALIYCYGSGIRADGIFGPLTKSALQSAQRREGVQADGVYGPVTSAHLKFMAVDEISDRWFCGGRR